MLLLSEMALASPRAARSILEQGLMTCCAGLKLGSIDARFVLTLDFGTTEQQR